MLNLIIWNMFIMSNLFKDNDFLNKCHIADENVVNGKIVVIPQAGAKSAVTKNRSSLPASVTTRTDDSIVYLIDEFTTDPKRIENAEKYELSYEKMASILSEDLSAIKEAVAENILYEWVRAFTYSGAGNVAAAPVLRTGGAAVGSHLPSATGNRRLFTPDDLKAARTLMNKQNVPKENRVALMSSDMLDQLMNDSTLKTRDVAKELDMKTGVIAQLYGFEIMERSSVTIYDNTGTPVVKAPGALAASTDNDGVVCFQKNAVERAVGTVTMFQDLANPLYYGDIYSMLVRAGGRKRRKNAEGIVSIVQAASA